MTHSARKEPVHIAFVAVVEPDGFAVATADAENKGYSPYARHYPTMEAAQARADELNAEFGISRNDAKAVKICSMFRPGEYDEVRPMFGPDDNS